MRISTEILNPNFGGSENFSCITILSDKNDFQPNRDYRRGLKILVTETKDGCVEYSFSIFDGGFEKCAGLPSIRIDSKNVIITEMGNRKRVLD